MKIRLADYIANFLVENKINHGFTVVGGGAMYLNDAFGHKNGLKMIYNHHEQASSIAAESYARLNNKPALVCVTTGPGGINALNGVCSAYLDSLPMIVISGQVKYETSSIFEKEKYNISLRSMGDQEFDIIESVKRMTKYAVVITNPNNIKFELERAFHLATTGRKGPTWIDIPVDFQGKTIDTSKLKSYYGSKTQKQDDKVLPPPVKLDSIINLINDIKNAKRPVIYAGYGIRLSGAYETFRKLIKILNVPIATYWNAIDLIETNNPLYCGRGGNMGDRAGNFAVQNSDLLIAIGTRLSIRQVGYNYKDFAREAKIVMIDIDKNELNKHTLKINNKIWADAKEFIDKTYDYLQKNNIKTVFNNLDWNQQCIKWKLKYPVVDEKKYKNKNLANVYVFVKNLSEKLKENSLSVVSNGACCVVGHQAYVIKKGMRFHNNNAIASMGYGLPAAIGACISNNNKETICLEGDGSIMMNMQELQTILTNKLPIKIFLINNSGYQSIRITQNNIFSNHSHVGIGKESKDISFPDYEKIAKAFGYKYFKITNNSQIDKVLNNVLNTKGPIITEVFTDTNQVWEPKSSGKKLKNGKIISPPLEDLAPFLSRDELKENMYIKCLRG